MKTIVIKKKIYSISTFQFLYIEKLKELFFNKTMGAYIIRNFPSLSLDQMETVLAELTLMRDEKLFKTIIKGSINCL